jgi:acyl-CoA hydrolase
MSKHISFSKAETCMIMEPYHSNVMGNVHGGELMKIMDNIAGITAFKHAKGDAVTARVDEIVFMKPVNIGDIVTCVGQLTYVGRSSMQIMVSIYVNDLNSEIQPEASLTAFFTMVHLVDGKAAEVPRLIPKTPEEEAFYKLGEKKYYEIKAKY